MQYNEIAGEGFKKKLGIQRRSIAIKPARLSEVIK